MCVISVVVVFVFRSSSSSMFAHSAEHGATRLSGTPLKVDVLTRTQKEIHSIFRQTVKSTTNIHAVVDRGCLSFALTMISHNMIASSPSITRQSHFDTRCTYCGLKITMTQAAR